MSVVSINRSQFLRDIFNSRGYLSYDQVCEAWQGLGYPESSTPKKGLYQVVKSLHKGAKKVNDGEQKPDPIKAHKPKKVVKPTKVAAASRSNDTTAALVKMESALDGLIAQADAMSSTAISDALRQARRQVGRRIIDMGK